ncbi:MAG: hypothetical protein MRZ57_05235 [Bacteroidales bacterium]|nr:hypothetical protein [Bacteroidales bacterium]
MEIRRHALTDHTRVYVYFGEVTRCHSLTAIEPKPWDCVQVQAIPSMLLLPTEA